MNYQLKKATLVKCADKKATVILVIQGKSKKNITRIVEVEKIKGDSAINFLHDYWNSIVIGKTLLDVNLWHEDKGLFKATLYPTKQNGEFVETITNVFSGCKLKTLPLSEYKLINKN